MNLFLCYYSGSSSRGQFTIDVHHRLCYSTASCCLFRRSIAGRLFALAIDIAYGCLRHVWSVKMVKMLGHHQSGEGFLENCRHMSSHFPPHEQFVCLWPNWFQKFKFSRGMYLHRACFPFASFQHGLTRWGNHSFMCTSCVTVRRRFINSSLCHLSNVHNLTNISWSSCLLKAVSVQ